MKKYLIRLAFFLYILLSCFSSFAQTSILQEEIRNLLLIQRDRYPQEKAYLHFDRNHYIAGDTVWFRGYLVDAGTHVPAGVSRYLYVDLLNPADSVVQRLRIRNNEGAYPGYFALPDDMPEGDYTVWAYTMFMQNMEKEYYFRTQLRVSDPLSSKIGINAAFSEDPESRRFSVDIALRDIIRQTAVQPKELKTRLNLSESRKWTADPQGNYRLSFRNVDFSRNNVLLLDYDKSRRYIQVPSPSAEFNVSFYPEGGYLTPGGVNTLAFKSVNNQGRSEYFTGELFDGQGNLLTTFAPDHKGMGMIRIYISNATERYYAVCTNRAGDSRRFELPEIRGDVTGLNAVQRNGYLFVAVSQPVNALKTDTLFVVLHSRGVPFRVAPFTNQAATLRFDIQKIPTGVAHLLLLDNNRNILNERLVYIRNNDQARVDFIPDQPAYGYRMPVKVAVSLKDADGAPLTGGFSVAVTDDRDLSPDSTRNIYTELLLSSDLRGYIESPAWYFEEHTPERERALDALMLTQGWRRYDLPALFQKKVTAPAIPIEMGMVVSGKVKALLSVKPSVATPVYMIMPALGDYLMGETDEEGRFSFSGYEVPDSTGIFIQALSRRGNDRVEIILDEEPEPPVLSAIPGEHHLAYSSADQAYIAKADQKWIIENGMRTIHMDAVQVTGRKKEEFDSNSIYSGLADNLYGTEFLEKWHINEFRSLLYMIPGVTVGPGDQISIRNGGTPLFVVDDITMPQDFDWTTINMFDVERVEVIKGATAAIFGVRGGNGVFLIYTKRGGGVAPERIAFNRKVLSPLGYQKPAQFYVPSYETPEQKSNRQPDLRTTIYWNPSIRTNEEGEAVFYFFTADSPSTYSVIIQGITDNGKVIYSLGKIDRP